MGNIQYAQFLVFIFILFIASMKTIGLENHFLGKM